jgi:hypothetical protein
MSCCLGVELALFCLRAIGPDKRALLEETPTLLLQVSSCVVENQAMMLHLQSMPISLLLGEL